MKKQPTARSQTTPGTTRGETLKEFAERDEREAERQRAERALHQVKLQRAEIGRLQGDNQKLQDRVDLLEKIDSVVPEPPTWVVKPPSAKGRLHCGIPTLMLSDCHFDEIVNPDEVEGVNKYDRRIAVMRLQKILEGTITVTRKYFAGLTYEGMVLMLGGDMLSGNIHEELVQTNEDTVLGSVDYWADQLIAFILALADNMGKLHIPAVVGNHGRNTRKPRAKLKVRDNFDWALYRIIARSLAHDSRITFQIPESADTAVKIYNTNYRLTHGDQFRGGSGIAGMLSPLMLGTHRKGQRQMSINRPFDWMVIGHWHQYFMGKGLIVNGSLKSYDEYAYNCNFAYERSIQALFITTEKNGLTFPAPIYGDDRAKEGW